MLRAWMLVVSLVAGLGEGALGADDSDGFAACLRAK